ncbi:hypothetical protein KW849_14695 [Pseudomonas sp. PDM26]|uniref:hypothetical protein n=1 Tax=Pseudomonas TaxID=286 RepID=UPI001C48821D|nr:MULTISPECIES: hypothetical protein [Pseudomonas]MBV7547538.1 hypothetical protein [Pseudomonas sp. PDM26]MCT9827474.1 hypothetical protein [Pseudomonas veronii]
MQNISYDCAFMADEINVTLKVDAADLKEAFSQFLKSSVGLFLSQKYSIGTGDLDSIPGTHSSVVTLQEQGWALFVSPTDLTPVPTVVVRRTTNDEVLVESNQVVRVLYLEDDKSGDWDPDESNCVTLANTEMWLTRFDVSPTDLGPVLADLKIGITA